MPNWCLNDVKISPITLYDETIEKLIVSEEGIDFGIVVPQPEFDDDSDHPLGTRIDNSIFPAWYAWRLMWWGTKWNGGEFNIHRDPANDFVTITFSTAWSPPEGWFSKLCDRLEEQDVNGSMSLTYLEPGVGFAGRFEYIDGQYTEDNYADDSEEYKALYLENYGPDDEDDDIVLIDLSNSKK